jgi:hypothetical protein
VTGASSTAVIESFTPDSSSERRVVTLAAGLLRNLPRRCALPVSGAPLRAVAGDLPSAATGARTGRSDIYRDLSDRRCDLAPCPSLRHRRRRTRRPGRRGRSRTARAGASQGSCARRVGRSARVRRAGHTSSCFRGPRARAHAQRSGQPRGCTGLADREFLRSVEPTQLRCTRARGTLSPVRREAPGRRC